MTEKRNTQKKDRLPRGLFFHSRIGTKPIYGIRFMCQGGHVHEERVGPLKSLALRRYNTRREQAQTPGWCPREERTRQRVAERERVLRQTTFGVFARRYLEHAKVHLKSASKVKSRLESALLPAFRERALDNITTADIEKLRNGLMAGRAPATVNRFRDQLSAVFKYAMRHGLVGANPVTGIPKLKEAGGRVVYLTDADVVALYDALPAELRPAVTVALGTGVRWSELERLQWRNTDLLTSQLTITDTKNAHTRHVPMNAQVRAALIGVATERETPDDGTERVFNLAYRTVHRAFERAAARAVESLRDAGKEASRLDGLTWHGLRHAWASKLAMNGVDLLTLQRLGGWRTLSQVQRYAHLSDDHLRWAVDSLVTGASTQAPAQGKGRSQLGLNLDLGRDGNTQNGPMYRKILGFQGPEG
jgi:integrase